MVGARGLVVPALWATSVIAQNIPSGASSSYVLPGVVTTAFSSYWNDAASPTSEPEVTSSCLIAVQLDL